MNCIPAPQIPNCQKVESKEGKNDDLVPYCEKCEEGYMKYV
jgi:hypothetical protein